MSAIGCTRSPFDCVRLASLVVFVGALVSMTVPIARAQPTRGLQCFRIKDSLKLRAIVDIDSAQLGLATGCKIRRAVEYCVPVTTDVQSASSRGNPLDMLDITGPRAGDQVCYRINCGDNTKATQEVSDQFGYRTMKRMGARKLCVPAVPGPPDTPPPGMCLPPDPVLLSNFVPVCNSGGGPASGTLRSAGTPQAPTLRIFAVYESPGVPAGTAQTTVHVEKEEHVVLVLSSYEETNWVVTAAAGATIEKIVVVGYEQQWVTAPGGVPVDNLSPYLVGMAGGFEVEGCCDLIVADEWPSSITDEFVAAAEAYTGLCLTSYYYCYGGGEMVVPDY